MKKKKKKKSYRLCLIETMAPKKILSQEVRYPFRQGPMGKHTWKRMVPYYVTSTETKVQTNFKKVTNPLLRVVLEKFDFTDSLDFHIKIKRVS